MVGEAWICGAGQLEALHTIEDIEQLTFIGVVFQADGFEGKQELVAAFDGGEAAILGLLFDEVAAGCCRGEHHAGQTLEARAETEHLARAGPGGVEQEDQEPTSAEKRGGDRCGGKVVGFGPGVEQDGVVGRVREQRLDIRVPIKVRADEDAAV